MTVFESLMITFATLVVAILSEQKNVSCPLEGLLHTRPYHVLAWFSL